MAKENVIPTHKGTLLGYEKDEILLLPTTWTDVEMIPLTAISQAQKGKYLMIPLMAEWW